MREKLLHCDAKVKQFIMSLLFTENNEDSELSALYEIFERFLAEDIEKFQNQDVINKVILATNSRDQDRNKILD
jgi:hypothetical protein